MIYSSIRTDPEVIEQARKDGISEEWIEAAQNSPVYKLAIEYKLAFPLHPEYRTCRWFGMFHHLAQS